MTSEIEEIISLIFSAGRAIKECVGKNNNHNYLLHIRIIDFVNKRRNPTMKELSGFLRVKAPTATSIANLLINKGKIKKIPDKEDSRVVRLMVTKNGARFFGEYKKKISPTLKKELSKINGKERRELIRILEKIV